MSLWPDPSGFPDPGITRRCALRSADFPLVKLMMPTSLAFANFTSGHPTGLGHFYLTTNHDTLLYPI